MRISHLVARAGRNQQLPFPFFIIGKIPAKVMMKKRKTPLQATSDLRIFPLPFTPSTEWK